MVTIQNCMKQPVYFLPEGATVREAIEILIKRHIGLIPIVDQDHKLVGIIGIKDILSQVVPSITLFEDIDFISDLGAVEMCQPSDEILSKQIHHLMRPSAFVEGNCGLIKAYALMLQKDFHDLPVVDQEDHPIGIASRVDIGTKILSGWVKGNSYV